VLTPNLPELGRLAAGAGVELPGPIGPQWQARAPALAAALGGVVVVSKGPRDVVTDGKRTAECAMPCSLRRAGGQGDVLAGARGGWAAGPVEARRTAAA
jgi:ATP-dependent NAD(P)H-hydrate dehydratase